MKRYAVAGISVLAVVWLVTGVLGSMRRNEAMEVRFNKRDLPEYGIEIITPADASFDEMAGKFFENRPPANLKPFAVFIKNSTSRLVVAYALVWELKDQDGRSVTYKAVNYSEPGILIGNEIPVNLKHTIAIEPGSMRCFSLDSKIERDQVESENPRTKQFREIIAVGWAQTSDVIVSLDGVIFDDGSFIGPNQTAFIDQMRGLVNAKTDLLHDIAEASEGEHRKQVFEKIREITLEPDVVFGSTPEADDWYRHFKKLYAIEITNQRVTYGEKKKLVPLLLKSHGRVKKLKKLGSDVPPVR